MNWVGPKSLKHFKVKPLLSSTYLSHTNIFYFNWSINTGENGLKVKVAELKNGVMEGAVHPQ